MDNKTDNLGPSGGSEEVHNSNAVSRSVLITSVIGSALLGAIVAGVGVYVWQQGVQSPMEERVSELEERMETKGQEEQMEASGGDAMEENEEMAASSQQTDSEVRNREGWLLHTNKYKFSFLHPSNIVIGSNNYGVLDATRANSIGLAGATVNGTMGIRNMSAAYAPNPGECAGISGSDVDLKQYAENVWNLNKEDAKTNTNVTGKHVGQLSKVTVGGQTAYQFTVTKSRHDACGGSLLGGELKLVYVAFQGDIFEIAYPTSSDPVFEQIVDTMQFHNREFLEAQDVDDGRVNPSAVALYVNSRDVDAYGEPRDDLPATTNVLYISNRKNSMRMELPYNQKWGTDDYRISGYDVYGDADGDNVVIYGPLTYCEPGSLCRDRRMRVLEPQPVDAIVSDVQNDSAVSQLERKTIGTFDTVSYHESGLCGKAVVVVATQSANYEFSRCTEGLDEYSEVINQIETIVQSMEPV